MPDIRLTPAALAFVAGVPYSNCFDDVYHSSSGGLAQAEHVFLGGNGLPGRWRDTSAFTVLETGFGLGLNFLRTWQAWQEDEHRCQRLHYVAIEKHPFTAADLALLHERWPSLAPYSAALRAIWPPMVPGFHRLLLAGGRVVLTLIFGDVTERLRQVDASVDAFYLDGFAPGKNPDMWTEDVLGRVARLARPGATLATYTVAAAVRRALTAAGFTCEKQPGYGRKREMLVARFAPRWPLPTRRPGSSTREALVIGAGIAGSAACERLAGRGWRVTLIERHHEPARETSGNLAGIVMPLLSKDDNHSSRLLRAAYLFTLQWWRHLGGIGSAFRGEACGVLQLARDAQQAQAQRRIATLASFPSEYAQWLEPQEVAQRIAIGGSQGGWFFPGGGWVQPGSLCRALLDACGDRLQRRFGEQADRLVWRDGLWQALDRSEAVIAAAPVVILASGADTRKFEQTRNLPLFSIRGQVSHVPASILPALPHVVCADGYLTPPVEGTCSVGATYDPNDEDQLLRRTSHEENLLRLAQMLPGLGALSPELMLAGRVGFRSAVPDRLPLVGALPDPAAAATMRGSRLRDVPRLAGMHALLGYGSRGLTWAGFAAELLAAHLDNEPLPVEAELAAALDPARFLLKVHRRSGSG